jgi:hypothetical protein
MKRVSDFGPQNFTTKVYMIRRRRRHHQGASQTDGLLDEAHPNEPELRITGRRTQHHYPNDLDRGCSDKGIHT